ncbi:hypothetical protein [Trichormus sp. NMC-1]|nr:hypothetical protein [Trichormus sp. NMC-1]
MSELTSQRSHIFPQHPFLPHAKTQSKSDTFGQLRDRTPSTSQTAIPTER